MEDFPRDENNGLSEFNIQINSVVDNTLDGECFGEMYESNLFGSQDALRTAEEIIAQLNRSNEEASTVTETTSQPVVQQGTKMVFKDTRGRSRTRSTSRIKTGAVPRPSSGRGGATRSLNYHSMGPPEKFFNLITSNNSSALGSSSSRTVMEVKDEQQLRKPKEITQQVTAAGCQQVQMGDQGISQEGCQIGQYEPRGLHAKGSSTGLQQQPFASGSRETYARQHVYNNQPVQVQNPTPQKNREKAPQVYPNVIHQKGETFCVTTVCTECTFKKEFSFKTPGLWPPNKCSQCHSKCNIANWKTSETELSEEIIYLGEFSTKEDLVQRKNDSKVYGADGVKLERPEPELSGPQCRQCGGYHNNKGHPPGFCPHYPGYGHQGFHHPNHPPFSNIPYGTAPQAFTNAPNPAFNPQMPFGNTPLPYGNTGNPYGNMPYPPYGNPHPPAYGNSQQLYGNSFQPHRNPPYQQYPHWNRSGP